jgi:hypothetical protein
MQQMRTPPNGSATEWIKYLGAVSSLLIALIVIPMGTWLILTTLDHSSRLTRIESNRFTSADAMKMYELLSRKADRADIPTPEVKQSLGRLERDVQEVRKMMEEHMTYHANGRQRGGIGPDIIDRDDP